jgi:MFS family permease
MAVAVATVATYALPLFFTASLALDIERDLDMTVALLGVAITAFWVVATASSFPAGRLVDRVGPVRAGRVAGGLVVLGSLGIAAAPSFAVFVACLGVTAIGNAIIPTAMSALVTGELRARRRGTVLGLQQAGPPLASVIAGLALPTLGATLGWRAVFALGAAAAALATLAVRGGEERRIVHAPATATGQAPGEFIRLLALGGLLASAAASGLVAYLVVYAADVGLSEGAAGILLASASLLCVATRFGSGARVDRRRAPLLPQMAALAVAGAVGFALLVTGAATAVVVGSLLALGIGWGWSGLYILAAVEHGTAGSGRAVGTAVSGSFAGATLGPLLVALVATEASFEIAWAVCGVLSLAGAAAFVVAGRLEMHVPRVVAG